jgi:uncharacterized membrane protein YoaK (UPF0700 family)
VSDARRRDVLLVALTFAAGAVDAVVFLRLDVFTAVMTGNIVLLGLAVGQSAFRNAVRSLIALAAYVGGVLGAARLVGAAPRDALWPAHVTRALAIECALQAVFLGGWVLTDAHPDGVAAASLIGVSGLAMGIQAATARTLAPGLSTTYVTGTLTALLSELSALGAIGPDARRRASIVVALALGATSGALVLVSAPLLAPALPLAVIALVVVIATTRFRD